MFVMKPMANFSLFLGYYCSGGGLRGHGVRGGYASFAGHIEIGATGGKICI